MRRVTFFHILWMSLVFGLIEDSWILTSTSVFYLSWQIVLVEENLILHRDIIRTGRSSLMVFLDNCGHGCSLILHQNLTRGHCLKVSCNMESETLWVNFSFSVAVKHYIGLFCTVNGSLTHAWFRNIKYQSLKKYWLTDLRRYSSVAHSL